MSFQDALNKILNKEARKGQPAVDILEINRLRRQLLFQSYMWDHRLIYVASSDNICQREMAVANSAPDVRPNEEICDLNVSVRPGQGFDSSNLASPDVNLDESHHHGVSGGEYPPEFICDHGVGGLKNPAVLGHQETDGSNPNSVKGNLSFPSSVTDIRDESVSLESNVSVHGVLSDGQFPVMVSLSETLDAAWTGETNPGLGLSMDDMHKVSDTASLDSSTTGGAAEMLDTEGHGEELTGAKIVPSPFLSSRVSDNVEDTVSWLGLPFISFYRSLNKNFLGNNQKLDTLSEYNPVYISSFRQLELQGGARLLLPVGFNDTVVPVYDDEPTSVIAYVLASPDYLVQLSDDLERLKDMADLTSSLSFDSGSFQSFHSMDEIALEPYRSLGSADESILSMSSTRSSSVLDPFSYTKAMHARVSLTDDGPLGKVKYTVTCYYAKRFEALRRICCPSEIDFIRSLSRCKKWGAQGGKSNVFFAKTLDDRFIIKQVTKTELESFIKFAPGYFKYLSESIGSGSPTCLAKILGIYQVLLGTEFELVEVGV